VCECVCESVYNTEAASPEACWWQLCVFVACICIMYVCIYVCMCV